MFKPLLTTLAMALFVTSCGDIQESSTTKTSGVSVGEAHVAGIGDAILSIQNAESLPNAFGGADIFGRKRPTGTTTVYYEGFREGKAQFNRRDVLIHSEKTTMNSSPIVVNPSTQTSYSGNFGGVPYSGSSNTNAYPIFLPPNTPRDRVAAVRDLSLSVAVGQPVVIAGRQFTVVAADANQVKYKLE